MKNYRGKLFLTDEQLVQKYCESAKAYSSYVNTSILFIFSIGRNFMPMAYEVYFGEENFIHLTGCTFQKKIDEDTIINAKYNAKDFYKNCLQNSITLDSVLYKHNKETSCQKSYILPRLLDFTNCKIYKIGKHDKINQFNDFEVAIGSQLGILGVGHKNLKITHSIPMTVLPNPITEYSTAPHKILYVLQNNGFDSKYKPTKYCKLIYEIKAGLFMQEANDTLSTEILDTIDKSLYEVT